jgi:hypothetical protein
MIILNEQFLKTAKSGIKNKDWTCRKITQIGDTVVFKDTESITIKGKVVQVNYRGVGIELESSLTIFARWSKIEAVIKQ